MHVIIWTAANQRYAIATRLVVEVVPPVAPRQMARAPKWVRGLMNYRGQLIPLIDASGLLGDGGGEPLMSNRVLVIRIDDGIERRVGLLVESVESVEAVDLDDASAHRGFELPDAAYLGRVAQAETGTVQLVEPAKLLNPEQKTLLFRGGEAAES
jgi:chemotaxis-related protein WspB